MLTSTLFRQANTGSDVSRWMSSSGVPQRHVRQARVPHQIRGASSTAGRGRSGSYLPPPAQIPACGFSAPGSCRRSNATDIRGLGGPSSSGPWAQAVGNMPVPALCPGYALVLALPSTLPSTLSATSLSAGVVRGFIGTLRPSDSSYLPIRLRLLTFPNRPGIAVATAGGMRSPRFRRVPFERNGVFDHGRAVAPRMTVRNMLPSTFSTVSAPANLYLSRLNNPLHTIAVYASPWSSPSTPQHSLPGDPLRSYPGRTSTGWNAPASPGAPKIYCSELHAILTSGFGKADHGVRQRHDSTGSGKVKAGMVRLTK
jgi:hypothetical protein